MGELQRNEKLAEHTLSIIFCKVESLLLWIHVCQPLQDDSRGSYFQLNVMLLSVQAASTKETGFDFDDAELEKKKQEAEEQRLADIRAQGTPVTPQTFAHWKQRFDTEVRLKRAELEPEAVSRDKGPSGKIFFQNQDIANATRVIFHCSKEKANLNINSPRHFTYVALS